MDNPSDGLGRTDDAVESAGKRRRRSDPDLEQLRTVLTMVPDPVVVAKKSGEIVTGNDELAQLFERPLSALRDEPLQSLFPDLTTEAIEANCDAEPAEYVTCLGVRRGEPDLWVDLSFDSRRLGGRTFLVGTLHDVTDSRERIHKLEQYERIIETMEDGVYTLDESFTIETINSAVESMTGYDEAELVGESATLLADESVIDEAARLSTELLAGERDAATLTADLETADGGTLPVETRFSTYVRADDERRQVGVIRDISDRRRFERTLAALHDSTRELLEAQTADEVNRLVVESATEVLELTGAAIYEFDRSGNALRPVAVSDGLGGDPDEQPTVDPDDGGLWDAFVEGDSVPIAAADDPLADGAESGGICFPLGEHGVLYAGTGEPGAADADTVEVLELLAASAEAALARVDRERALRARDETLREQNDRLRRLEEVNTIIRRIDQALVDADTAAEIEQAVCDRLTASSRFAFAWIGRLGAAELEPRAWAGRSPSYLDAVSLTTAGEGGPPALRTARREEMTVVPSVADGLQTDRWRAEAVSRDFQSVISVPLQSEGVSYGVLTVYGTDQSAFGEMLESVFAELGETIANAIRDVESRQRQSDATTLELEVSLSAPTSPLGRIADACGETVVCEGAVPEAGDTTRLFFRIEADGGEAATDPCERCADLTCVESMAKITDDEDGGRFEAVVSGRSVAQRLRSQGARIGSIRVDPGGERTVATVRLSSGTDVRRFVDRLGDRYRDVQLLARRQRDGGGTGDGVRSAVADGLTDRQLQVLRTAYFSGFFEWPRETSGQALADRLGVSQPTVSRHLRVGNRKVLAAVFDGEID